MIKYNVYCVQTIVVNILVTRRTVYAILLQLMYNIIFTRPVQEISTVQIKCNV